MFARQPEPDPTPEPQPEPAPPSNLPIAFQGKAARLKRWPPHDPNTPRLVSFGVRTVIEKGRPGRPDRSFEIEGACDARNTSRTFWRYAGDNEPWHENDVSSQPGTKVLDTLTVPTRIKRDSGGRPDEHTKFPPLTPMQRAVGEVMRGVVSEH